MLAFIEHDLKRAEAKGKEEGAPLVDPEYFPFYVGWI